VSLLLAAAAVAALDEFAFVEGRWCGRALDGAVEERWEAPFGDAMSGTMTLVREGSVVFHEFFVITEAAGGWQLRLKHFNADVVGWEAQDEVVTFPLIAVADGRAEFDGLVIQRTGADRLRVEVVDGPVFDYTRCADAAE